MKKAIILGNYTNVSYHPLKGPDKELKEILKTFETELTEDYDRFRETSLRSFDLCVSYTEDRLSDEQVAGLCSYVLNGGGLLAIHNGISVNARYEAAHLIGGRFSSHPDQKVLTYKPVGTGHAILEGIESFSMQEEPYQFDIDNLIETTVLLEYESEGRQWPAAWAHSYGLGRVVYLSPGHIADSFMDPVYRKLILQSALWAARQ
ncbi:MAG: ThuA domain-containing protein [Clostridiaceae bacterium]|nr:ThuA domain-containing protein [Clostridiaceae bacterium]